MCVDARWSVEYLPLGIRQGSSIINMPNFMKKYDSHVHCCSHCVMVVIQFMTCLSCYRNSFYKNIFNTSGAAQLAQKYGDWFTWDGSPRAKIFARNHTSVTNITTMIKLMRYVFMAMNGRV